jgi:flagellar secretion chaperone FliS
VIRHAPSSFQSYKKVATQTASPGQLVLMLFDGAIRFLEQAQAGFAHDDPGEFNLTINNNVQRAQAIIDELNGSLDMARGGELSHHLRALYNYLDRRLDESNRTKTPEGIRESLERLGSLRAAWAGMLVGDSESAPAMTAAAA